MDWCREDRAGQFRLFRDNLAILVPVKWYIAPKGAKFFPSFHLFGNEKWFQQDQSIQVGEYLDTRTSHLPGPPPATVAGQNFCGPLDWFANGVPLSSQPVPLTPDGRTGFPICCGAFPIGMLFEANKVATRLPAPSYPQQKTRLKTLVPAVAYGAQQNTLKGISAAPRQFQERNSLASLVPTVGRIVSVNTLKSFPGRPARLTETDGLLTRVPTLGRLTEADRLLTRVPTMARLTEADSLLTRVPTLARLTEANGIRAFSSPGLAVKEADRLLTRVPMLARLVEADLVRVFSAPGASVREVDSLRSLLGTLGLLSERNSLLNLVPSLGRLAARNVVWAQSSAGGGGSNSLCGYSGLPNTTHLQLSGGSCNTTIALTYNTAWSVAFGTAPGWGYAGALGTCGAVTYPNNHLVVFCNSGTLAIWSQDVGGSNNASSVGGSPFPVTFPGFTFGFCCSDTTYTWTL